MYNIVDQIFFSFLICGQATLCWHICLNNEHYVVKDSWTWVNQVSCEEDILRKIQDLKGVPQLVAAWTVEIGGSDDGTHLHCESIFPLDDVRIHCRLVMWPVATPLSNFNSIHELLSVFIDVLDTHMTLIMQYFILHHDISDNNLMIYPCDIPKGKTKQRRKVEALSSERCLRDDKGSQDDDRDSHAESCHSDAVDIGKEETHEQKLHRWDQERCQQIQAGILHNGLLIDFDYATKLDQYQPRGTIPFMSASILIGYKKDETTHSASDDLESIIYVLVWMCVLYAGPRTVCQDKHVTQTVLKPWVSMTNPTDAVNLGLHKRGLTMEPSMVTDKFTTFFKPLCSTVDKLLRALGSNWSTTDDALNYKTIRDILLEAIFLHFCSSSLPMAASDPRKRLTQSDHTFPQETGPDARKKPRKVNPADTSTCKALFHSVKRQLTSQSFYRCRWYRLYVSLLQDNQREWWSNYSASKY
ncbi:hypothetical protein PISMIDRAFT_105439 [Pisolithus microcarpus 441]|uniref:Fungal-type protein kinase domain-containing protein n=1 Tax=Pisolithus microcarpus 441 TaxID=765257 RepID=A0A0C9Y7G9_9AGAM|nr:hypothetical protein BKA83DRAFT_105439 [Pisolithus microcarpus]KIK20625.1 hypothetical protein PISMIDRAFT_105439 [Pisolithus microcarpus 441]